MRRRLLLPFVLLLLATGVSAAPLAAQAATLRGVVVDTAGRPMDGAAVSVEPLGPWGDASPRRTRTDVRGAFRVDGLAAGRWRVRAERLGHETAERTVELDGGAEVELRLVLRPGAVALEGIVAEAERARRRERQRFREEAGVTARIVEGRELKVLPGLGEADVLRAIEVLPGVVTTSDFSSAFNVRGGSADQNLVLLDGFPIVNPFHLGGLFGVFNGDVVERAELLAGGFGASYGGRVSSVLSVETDASPPADGHLRAEGGVSLLAGRLALRGALPGVGDADGGGWYLSGRRSYFDQLLRPVSDFPYHLTDLQAGASVPIGPGTLRLVAYTGDDVLDLTDFDPPGEDEPADVLKLRWTWGNDVAGARWTQPLGAWTAAARLGHTRFREKLGFADFGDVEFSSRYEQTTLGADLARPLGGALTLETGAEAGRTSYANRAEAGGTEFFGDAGDATLVAGYGQLRWRPARWIVEPGVRVDAWMADDATLTLVSPRLAAKRFLGADGNAAVKAAVGRYVQFVHSLRDENLPVSNDTWVAAGRDVPALVSDQAQLGVEGYRGGWFASAEAYVRRFRDVVDFNVAENPDDDADDLLRGRGTSYGLDLLLRRETGRVRGWAALSLLRARRTFPDPLAAGIDGVPQEVEFSPIFDRRVDLDVVLQAGLGRGWEAGARWNFGTGTPYTRPVGQFVGWEARPFGDGWRLVGEQERDDVPFYIVPGDRNSERYPAYHRLDLTVRRPFTGRWGTWTPYLQVLNVYDQRNVLFYFYDYRDPTPTRSGISMFPVLPSIGVEASF